MSRDTVLTLILVLSALGSGVTLVMVLDAWHDWRAAVGTRWALQLFAAATLRRQIYPCAASVAILVASLLTLLQVWMGLVVSLMFLAALVLWIASAIDEFWVRRLFSRATNGTAHDEGAERSSRAVDREPAPPQAPA